MASVRKQDIPQIGAFMTDLWELIKRYWIPEDTEEYWNSLTGECSRLTRKYQNEQFIVDMLAVFVDSRWDEMKNGG